MNLSESENAAKPDEATGTPGTLLGEARQAQNLSVADVARQLKLSVHQVEALEAGEYHKLPGSVFVRGFIRNYARLLKLEPERLVDSATRSLPQEEARSAAPPSQEIPFPTVAPRRWPRYALALAVAVIALAAYEFYPGETRPEASRSASAPPAASPVTQPQADVPAAPPASPEVGAAERTTGAAGDAGQVPPPVQTAAGPQDTPAPAPVAAPDPALAVPGSDPRDYEPAPKPGEREVRMIFAEESWVEIRDRSGKAIFSQLNRRGTEKRVNGRPPLSVIVGNSHGVRLTYDDQPVDLAPHTKVDVARLTLQ